ncbi:MAG: DUF2062 domain-containing protein [Candidatus Omnitrophota bacterium]|nr:DUF2062 domain-containing protein [Candidatus Omnitrophota bacterium]
MKVILVGLFTLNDTPQKIAFGLGLGVFSGILPGTGPIAAVFLAALCRANRAASLIGSLATNTWLSFVTFVIAVKLGAWLWGYKWVDVYNQWSVLVKEFHWINIIKSSFLQLILPLFTGYIIVALALGITVYLIALIAFKLFRQGSCNKENGHPGIGKSG